MTFKTCNLFLLYYLFRFFDRDVECIKTFFGSRFNYESKDFPVWSEVKKLERIADLDLEVHATGFSKRQNELLLRAFALNEENRLANELNDKSETEEESDNDSEHSNTSEKDEDTTEEEKPMKAKPECSLNNDTKLDKDEFMTFDKRKDISKWVQLMTPADKLPHSEEEEVTDTFLQKYNKEKEKVEGNNKKLTDDMDILSLSGESDSFQSAKSSDGDDEIEDSASQIRKNGKKKNMTIADVLKDANQRVSVEAKKKIRQNAQKTASKNARRATVRVGRSQNKKSVQEYNKDWDRFDF